MIPDTLDVCVVICGNDSRFDTGSIEVFLTWKEAQDYGTERINSGAFSHYMIVKRIARAE